MDRIPLTCLLRSFKLLLVIFGWPDLYSTVFLTLVTFHKRTPIINRYAWKWMGPSFGGLTISMYIINLWCKKNPQPYQYSANFLRSFGAWYAAGRSCILRPLARKFDFRSFCNVMKCLDIKQMDKPHARLDWHKAEVINIHRVLSDSLNSG